MNIKVGYKNYTIKAENEVFTDDRSECYGEISYDQETIRIATKFSKNLQNEALIHEIVHAIADKYQLDINKDERTIDLLAAGIYELILDNTEQVKSFIEEVAYMKNENKEKVYGRNDE